MADLSLTDFVDIVSASGTPKLTKVRQVKHRPDYSPATDFYRPFREHVVEIHSLGRPRTELDALLSTLTDKKKMVNYPSLVDGYSRWWGRKSLSWFDPGSELWSAHGIGVRVNPELGLTVNESRHLIKLYLKADPISKNRLDIITQLMDEALGPHQDTPCTMSVLDVRRAKLISPTVPITGLSAALDGELAYVAAIWPKV